MKPPRSRASPSAKAPPSSPKRVRVKLLTIDDVRAEMARLYREARGSKIDTADASKLANILGMMGRLIEGSELERRLQELEKQRAKETSKWSQRNH